MCAALASWFQRLTKLQMNAPAVRLHWMTDQKAFKLGAGAPLLCDDGDWVVDHVGPALQRGGADLMRPVYLRSLSDPVDLPAASCFS